ncbi:hypothetical protein, partial [Saccharopolyspora sp. NPDC002578]
MGGEAVQWTSEAKSASRPKAVPWAAKPACLAAEGRAVGGEASLPRGEAVPVFAQRIAHASKVTTRGFSVGLSRGQLFPS